MQRRPGSVATTLLGGNDMKRLFISLLGILAIAFMAPAFAQSGSPSAPSAHAIVMHRYLVKRTFPAGALAGLDQATKDKVNATNAKFHVKWIESYANSNETLTYCVYEGPSEQAVREAAKANKLPVDEVIPVPVTLNPNSKDTVNH